jgi:tetratricopeptide (TPR) repeat protein
MEDRAIRESREAVKSSQWERAVAVLQPYLRAQPQDADGHNLLGFSLRKLGRHAESEAAYDRALAIDPTHLGAHEYRGELMLVLGRRDQALVHLQALERLCGLQLALSLLLHRQVIPRLHTSAYIRIRPHM